MPLVVEAQHGAAQGRVLAAAEQPDHLATRDPEQFEGVQVLGVRSAPEPVHFGRGVGGATCAAPVAGLVWCSCRYRLRQPVAEGSQRAPR